MDDCFYKMREAEFLNPAHTNFLLHIHEEYEILLFFEGDAKYVVEEKSYNLSPGDIIIIRKHEMHRIMHNSNAKYHRFLIWISPEFFAKHNCTEYEKAFLPTSFNSGHKINSDIVHSSGLYDAIMRLKKYTDSFTIHDSPIATSIIIEIMYLINKISQFETANDYNQHVKDVIEYINKNFTEKITLDMLSEHFYISKYHLCHIFKQSTGLTVQEYINQKRLMYASDLIRNGKNLTQAAELAGFSSYSSFYRSYVKQNKSNPRKQ